MSRRCPEERTIRGRQGGAAQVTDLANASPEPDPKRWVSEKPGRLRPPLSHGFTTFGSGRTLYWSDRDFGERGIGMISTRSTTETAVSAEAPAVESGVVGERTIKWLSRSPFRSCPLVVARNRGYLGYEDVRPPADIDGEPSRWARRRSIPARWQRPSICTSCRLRVAWMRWCLRKSARKLAL